LVGQVRSTNFNFAVSQGESSMIVNKFVSALGIAVLAAVSTLAQNKPGNIAALEFQTPKNGLVKQYEEGRKQKAAWHKQQKDTQPLYVWEVVAGDATGTYVVGRLGQHWADLDHPSVPDQADLDEYNKVISGSVQSMVARYFELLPDVSSPGNSKPTDKFSEIITYHVRYEKQHDFGDLLKKITGAIQKTKWPVTYLWYVLSRGGDSGTFVLVIPHSSWTDFEDKPDIKPFPAMLTDALGADEAKAVLKEINASVEKTTSEVIRFRDDLSYLPAK
jgi:hypothetical protein